MSSVYSEAGIKSSLSAFLIERNHPKQERFQITPVKRLPERGAFRLSKAWQIRLKSFSVGACTWQKILLRLQVCELCAAGAQGVRAADCRKLAEKPEGVFRQAQEPDRKIRFFLLLRR